MGQIHIIPLYSILRKGSCACSYSSKYCMKSEIVETWHWQQGSVTLRKVYTEAYLGIA